MTAVAGCRCFAAVVLVVATAKRSTSRSSLTVFLTPARTAVMPSGVEEEEEAAGGAGEAIAFIVVVCSAGAHVHIAHADTPTIWREANSLASNTSTTRL